MALKTSIFRATAQKATATVVSTTPANVYGWHIYNQDSADTFLQVYDLASGSVTVGTTVPTLTFWIPGLSGLDEWVTPSERELGLFRCSTAVTIAATATIGGSSAPATGLLINISYV